MECIEACQATGGNGVTMKEDGSNAGECWCEAAQTSTSSVSGYKNCLFSNLNG